MGEISDDALDRVLDDQDHFDEIEQYGPQDDDDRFFMEQYNEVDGPLFGPTQGAFGDIPAFTYYDMIAELRYLDVFIRGMPWKKSPTRFLTIKPQKERMWKTADNKVYKIKQMTTSHILNALAYMEKRGTSDPVTVEAMNKELERRHDEENKKNDTKKTQIKVSAKTHSGKKG